MENLSVSPEALAELEKYLIPDLLGASQSSNGEDTVVVDKDHVFRHAKELVSLLHLLRLNNE